MKWLESRLHPTFEARYGRGARMVLMLDNCSAHRITSAPELEVSTFSRARVVEELVKLGVEYLGIQDNETGVLRRVPRAIWAAEKKHPDGPSLDELRKQLKVKLKDIGDTRAERRLLILEWAKKHNYAIIWTPPNRSVLNMIEYCWRNAKWFVRETHVNFLRPKELAAHRRLHLHLGLYGDPSVGYFGMAPEIIPGLVREGFRQGIKMLKNGEGSSSEHGVLEFHEKELLGGFPRLAMTFHFRPGYHGSMPRLGDNPTVIESQEGGYSVGVTLRNLNYFESIIGSETASAIREAYKFVMDEDISCLQRDSA